MSAHDETEKVLRQIHLLLSKSEPYSNDPKKIVVEKQQVLDLLADLNKSIYNIMDEYELTQRSRDRAEREFRKHGDEIVWDASRKAEDIYAASVMYTDEALNRVWQIMHDTSEQMQEICKNMEHQLEEKEKMVKSNQLELKSQLQDLRDTEKYMTLIDERNRELQRQKEAGKPVYARAEKNMYANRQTEVKVNTAYLERLGIAPEEEADEVEENSGDAKTSTGNNASTSNNASTNNELSTANKTSLGNKEDKGESYTDKDKKDMTPEELEREEQLRADLDADYFNWKEQEEEKSEEKSDLSEGIAKMWKSIKSKKK